MSNSDTPKISFINRAYTKTKKWINYCVSGVWRDPRDTVFTRTIKTVNLSIRSFLDRELQVRAMALTYSTVLAIVPGFALLFAIGRGFGFQNLLHDDILNFFPAQKTAVETAFSFVDSYLSEASQGIFIGVGIVVLLWTLISLMSNIGEAFNNIWDIKRDRSIYQKFTDYIAICLLVPILMICSSGISIFISTTLEEGLHLKFLTPLINTAIEISPFIMVFAAFTFSFFLIPNTKVRFKYAAIAGAICAIMFQVLQLLFLNGQIYVSKYNAIYGSFAFLPLLLIWLELSWLILLFGCALCYSLQNVFVYNYEGNLSDISELYTRKITVVVMSIIMTTHLRGKKPITRNEISVDYGLPIRLVSRSVEKLHDCGIIYFVLLSPDEIGLAPAIDCDTYTMAELFKTLDSQGHDSFIPNFSRRFATTLQATDDFISKIDQSMPDMLLKDLVAPMPEKR